MRRFVVAVFLLAICCPASAATAWQPLGQSVEGTDLVGAPSLASVGGYPFVAYLGPNDEVRVSVEDGTGWHRRGGALNVNPAAAVPPDGTPQLIDHDGELFVVWTEAGVPHVKHENGADWEDAGDPFQLSAGEKAEWVSGDSERDTYIAWVTRDALAGTSKLRVANGSPGAWQPVGGVINADPLDQITDVKVVVIDNVPYLLYREVHGGVSRLRIVAYEGPGGWSPVGGPVAHIAGAAVSSPTLAATQQGAPTVAWYEADATGVDLRAARWNGTAWVELGGPINVNRSGTHSRPSLAPGSANFVAFSESVPGASARRVRVFWFDGLAWIKVGADLNRDSAADGTSPAVVLRQPRRPLVAWAEHTGATGPIHASESDEFPAPETTRVSVDSEEQQSNGTASANSAVSDDGRYVAFESDASNLVSGDTNGKTDVFVRDRFDGTTERVSIGAGATQGDGLSAEPSISGDGRYVAFESAATNLVVGDTNDLRDVFVRDREAGTTERVSVSTDGAQALDYLSRQPSISNDGRYVGFQSFSAGLVPDDTNDVWDVFLHDRQTGTTERVSVGGGGTQAAAPSYYAAVSGDGRYVAFESSAGLVAGDGNGVSDVYVRDRQTQSTERVTFSIAGGDTDKSSYRPSITSGGRYVAFESLATNLVGGDTNGEYDAFVRDRQTGVTERVSRAAGGTQGDDESYAPSISDDGRYVAFASSATNLGSAPDVNSFADVFVRDRQANTIEALSARTDGTPGNGTSTEPSLSGDGTYVAYESDASDLVDGDTNGARDIFGRGLPSMTPPAAPTVSAVSPASPANDNTPKVSGTAPAGATVTLYGSATCTGTALATGTAAAFASPGLTITVADNSTTSVYATATTAGRTSACSTSFVTYVEDSTHLVDTTISRGPDGLIADSRVVFFFEATPAAGATFSCAFDGAAPTPCTSPLTEVGLAEGAHTFAVQATSGAGDVDPTPATRTFTVDTVRPVTHATPYGTQLPLGAWSGPVQVRTLATDPEPGSGVAEVRCLIDPINPPQTASELRDPCPVTVRDPGVHTVYAAAIDRAGNAGIPASVHFTIARPPDTEIFAGPSGMTSSRPSVFEFRAFPGGTFECQLDDTPYGPCTSPLSYGALSLGAHVLRVRAVSTDGERDATPASRAFTLGNKTISGSCSGTFPVRRRSHLRPERPLPHHGLRPRRCALQGRRRVLPRGIGLHDHRPSDGVRR